MGLAQVAPASSRLGSDQYLIMRDLRFQLQQVSGILGIISRSLEVLASKGANRVE
jgi:hypothetical protein